MASEEAQQHCQAGAVGSTMPPSRSGTSSAGESGCGDDEHRVVGGENHAPQELGGGQGAEAQPLPVGLEQCGERFDVDPAPLADRGPIERCPPHPRRREQLPRYPTPAAA